MKAGPIDLRSDTVTRPSAKMRRAMAEAEVGDDVFEEDPTVRALEERTSAILGTEAALFVPTGSMGNQIALRLLAAPASEVLLEARAHIFNAEMAAMAGLSGLLPRPVATPDGVLTAALAEPAIQPNVSYRPRTGLVCVENTHNFWGGRTLPVEAASGLVEMCRRRGLPIHLDGSRLWNAAVAVGAEPAELARGFDTVNVCFSKGLGAPVGSALASSRDAIREARRIRKLFGGGMRQAGVLAAAALVSLENIGRLSEDHARAARLARGLSGLPGVELDAGRVETNIVLVRLSGGRLAEVVSAAFRERGVLCSVVSPSEVRFVTHLDIADDGIDAALAAAREVFRG